MPNSGAFSIWIVQYAFKWGQAVGTINLEVWGENGSRNRYSEAIHTWRWNIFLLLLILFVRHLDEAIQTCMLWLRWKKVAFQTWAHWSSLAALGPGHPTALQWESSGGTDDLRTKCQAVHDLWKTEINQSMPHRVFLRISRSCTEKGWHAQWTDVYLSCPHKWF